MDTNVYTYEGDEVTVTWDRSAASTPRPAWTGCRCGRSGNKPLCDGSHDEGFEDEGYIAVDRLSAPDDAEDDGPLRIRATEDGPFVVEGPVTIEATDEETVAGHRGALCRCGASESKPFCDGSHSEVGFEAD